MRKHTKHGFYTVEAAVFLPLVILTVLTIGYFLKTDSLWENCMTSAIDESSCYAAKEYVVSPGIGAKKRILKRLNEENPNADYITITRYFHGYSDGSGNHLTSYTLKTGEHLSLPLGFSRDTEFAGKIKYRGFCGIESEGEPLGVEGLEEKQPENPVWIFPQSGEKYHTEDCTYVKSTVKSVILTNSLKRKYKSCGLCDSESIPVGSVVFCFTGSDTAYHRGTCKSIDRHTVVIDKSEALDRGYTPCSKCGGD